MLEKWKATCNFNLSNLIGRQQSLKKAAALVLTMISLLNALLLTIQDTAGPSETSRSSAQRRTRPRSGKRPLEEAVIETDRKKLDLMQSMGNGREDWDTTYHFLMILWEPINRLPEDRQMFLRMKIQEMIFQVTQKHRETQSSTSSSQMQLFHYEDRRSNQGERGQHLTAQSFFQTSSE